MGLEFAREFFTFIETLKRSRQTIESSNQLHSHRC